MRLILFIMIIVPFISYGQIDTSLARSITTGSGLPLTLSAGSVSPTFTYGYNKTSKIDTIKCVLLITDCENCSSKSISAYVVREFMAYIGDPMPPGDYSHIWSPINYLDINKKPFNKSVIIWQCKR